MVQQHTSNRINSQQKTIQDMIELTSVLCTLQAEYGHPKYKEPYLQYTETEKILYKMLTENTGASILDSGGIGGRHWEQARGIKDFRNIPNVKIHRMYGATKHVFAIISDIAIYDKAVDNKFYKFAYAPENKEKSWLDCMEEFGDKYNEDRENKGGNTCNDEYYSGNQGMQYLFLKLEGIEYVILQIHGGCDMREGYTAPHVFECNYDDFVTAGADITIGCMCNGVYTDGLLWSDDNGDDLPLSWDDGLFPDWHWKTESILYCKECKEEIAW